MVASSTAHRIMSLSGSLLPQQELMKVDLSPAWQTGCNTGPKNTLICCLALTAAGLIHSYTQHATGVLFPCKETPTFPLAFRMKSQSVTLTPAPPGKSDQSSVCVASTHILSSSCQNEDEYEWLEYVFSLYPLFSSPTHTHTNTLLKWLT